MQSSPLLHPRSIPHKISEMMKAPVSPNRRLETVDILRGFALFGVLAANMVLFSGYDNNPAVYADFWDKAILIGIQFFIRAKFYTLFSFLFGWGMSVQMLNAAKKGHRFLPVFARRMAILFVFGTLHGTLIWMGDILTLYAILGVGLLLFRKQSERVLLITAVSFITFAILLNLPSQTINNIKNLIGEWLPYALLVALPLLLLMLYIGRRQIRQYIDDHPRFLEKTAVFLIILAIYVAFFRDEYEQLIELMRSGNLPNSIYATGDYWEITQKRVQDYLRVQSRFTYYIGNVFSMFLLGFYVGKRQIFRHVDDHLPLLKKTAVISLIIGVIFNGMFAYDNVNSGWIDPYYKQTATVFFRSIGAPALMLFYVSSITLLTRQQRWLARLQPLGNLGRMALTNYLAQSLIFTLIFYGYGLGLYGQTDPTFGFILTVAFFAVQMRLSGWWLRGHQFGPMEWLWRRVTYGNKNVD